MAHRCLNIGRGIAPLTSLLPEEADRERSIDGKAGATFARLKAIRPGIARKADALGDRPDPDLVPATEDTGAEETEVTLPETEETEDILLTGEEEADTVEAHPEARDLWTLATTGDPMTTRREATGNPTTETGLGPKATTEDLDLMEAEASTLAESLQEIDTNPSRLTNRPETADNTPSILTQTKERMTTKSLWTPTPKLSRLKTEAQTTSQTTKMSELTLNNSNLILTTTSVLNFGQLIVFPSLAFLLFGWLGAFAATSAPSFPET